MRKNDPNHVEPEVKNARIVAEYIESTSAGAPDAKILSELVIEPMKNSVKFISTLFFSVAFIYMTMTILLFGVSIALAITLTNAGSPGFIFLKYYPNIGALPVITCIMAMASMLVAHMIQDSSRRSWILGVLCLATIPAYTSLALPVMSYPLVKMVSAFAGTASKPIVNPSLTVSTLAQYFSVMLVFDIGLLFLLAYIKTFTKKPQPLDEHARTALAVIFLFVFVPISGVSAMGYWNAKHTDYDLKSVRGDVGYKVYTPRFIPGNRTPSTNFTSGEELAGLFDGVKVVYDVPLPTLIQTGIRSPIAVKQVKVLPNFNLQKFADTRNRDSGTLAEYVFLSNSVNKTAYITVYHGATDLWLVMPGDVLVNVSSMTADIHELTSLAESLK
jgi:hypothetical protein